MTMNGVTIQESILKVNLRRQKNKLEILTNTQLMSLLYQIASLAWEIQQKYFSCKSEGTRKVAVELQSILKSIEDACLSHESDMVSLFSYFFVIIIIC